MLLLAESYDQLSRSEEAQNILRYVIRESPRPIPLAHAGLGLLLLGTGSRNYGAMYACGLNRDEAMEHLRIALELAPRLPVLQQARDALAFCEKEMIEIQMWEDILTSAMHRVDNGLSEEKIRNNGGISDYSDAADEEYELAIHGDHNEQHEALSVLLIQRLKSEILNTIRSILRMFDVCSPSKVPWP